MSLLVHVEVASRSAWVEWTGFAAAFCTTTAFVPQLIRVTKLKTARDISLKMFLLFSTGVALWLVYGISLGSWPIMASNGVTLGLSLSILYFKLKYDRNDAEGMES